MPMGWPVAATDLVDIMQSWLVVLSNGTSRSLNEVPTP